MAKKATWDFECPQYVDFERELDRSGIDDVFFGCDDKGTENSILCQTPGIQENKPGLEPPYPDRKCIQAGLEPPYPDTKKNQGEVRGLTESDENRLLDRVGAALSMLENFTPKVKKNATRGKLFSDNQKSLASNATVKPYTVPARPQTSRRRSKSLNHLNKIAVGNTYKTDLPKSSSLRDLRVCRKTKYPVTPMCLKRANFKAKEKIKTTEERELDEIARLQKQMIQHLRQNEITLKKLKLNPRPAVVPKCDGLKGATGLNKFPCTSMAVPGTSSMADNETRRNIRMCDVKKKVEKLDSIMNKNAVEKDPKNKDAKEISPCKKMNNTIYCKKSTKKQTHSRTLCHSGLTFFPSVKSKFLVKSFTLEDKTKGTQMPSSAKPKEKSASSLVEDDKENIPHLRSRTVAEKSKEISIDKYDSILVESNKIAGKSIANPTRGVPLAENRIHN